MVVDIKEATPADAEAIQEIMQDAFHKYERDLGMTGHVKALQETVEDIRRDIEKKTVLVGFVDGVAVGSVRVRSAITKSGIGGMLIDRVEVLCREQSVRAIALHTSSRMFGLIRFYYGHGYFIHSTDESRGYIRALLVHELEMPGNYDLAPVMNR